MRVRSKEMTDGTLILWGSKDNVLLEAVNFSGEGWSQIGKVESYGNGHAYTVSMKRRAQQQRKIVC